MGLLNRWILLVISILYSLTASSQIEIPYVQNGQNKYFKRNVCYTIDKDYNIIWTAYKLIRTDIEHLKFMPPDREFFPNIAHQNSKLWNLLEDQVRMWAIEFDSLYVVTGCITLNDTVNQGVKAYYKAILKGCQGDAIGYLMQNNKKINDLSECVLSIDKLEEITQMDLFCSLNKDLQEIIESGYDLNFWPLMVE